MRWEEWLQQPGLPKGLDWETIPDQPVDAEEEIDELLSELFVLSRPLVSAHDLPTPDWLAEPDDSRSPASSAAARGRSSRRHLAVAAAILLIAGIAAFSLFSDQREQAESDLADGSSTRPQPVPTQNETAAQQPTSVGPVPSPTVAFDVPEAQGWEDPMPVGPEPSVDLNAVGGTGGGAAAPAVTDTDAEAFEVAQIPSTPFVAVAEVFGVEVQIRDLSAGELVGIYRGHGDRLIGTVIGLPDGIVASTGLSPTGQEQTEIHIWDPVSAQLIYRLSAGRTGCQLSVPEEDFLLARCRDGTYFWDLATQAFFDVEVEPADGYPPTEFQGAVPYVADNAVRVWDPAGRFRDVVLEGFSVRTQLADQRLLLSSSSGFYSIWNPAAPSDLRDLELPISLGSHLPLGGALVAVARGTSIEIWDLDSDRNPRNSWVLGDPWQDWAPVGDGRLVVLAAGDDPHLLLMDPEADAVRKVIPPQPPRTRLVPFAETAVGIVDTSGQIEASLIGIPERDVPSTIRPTARCFASMSPEVVGERFELVAELTPSDAQAAFSFNHGDRSEETGPTGSYTVPGVYTPTLTWAAGEHSGIVNCARFSIAGAPLGGWQGCDAGREPNSFGVEYVIRGSDGESVAVRVGPGEENREFRSIPSGGTSRFVACWQLGASVWWTTPDLGFVSREFVFEQ